MAEGTGTPGRRTFAPVVLAGLAGAGLAAVAGHQQWASGSGTGAESAALGQVVAGSGDGVGESPAAGALALVCLACWGVLLVTRGRVRRAVAVLATVAAAGVAVAVVVGFSGVPDAVRDALADVGSSDPEVSRTWWIWAAGLGAVVATVAGAAAVRLVPHWPEMGSRYDAPTGAAHGTTGPVAPVAIEEQSNLDLWKAIDEGHDPTAGTD